MNDKDKVKKYLKSISSSDICTNCSMSRHLHDKYPKNSCERFQMADISSHDGEARKDGWDE